MTVETDALTEAALRFSAAIRAERTNALDTLGAEREATLQLIKTLRSENQRRAQQRSGRFVVGFLLGSAFGAATTYVLNQRTSEEFRLGLAARVEQTSVSLGARLKAAFEVGRRAAATHEQELWTKYRQRLAEKPPAPPREDDPLI